MKKQSHNSAGAWAMSIAFMIALTSGVIVLATAASGSIWTKVNLRRGRPFELGRRATGALSTVSSASQRLFNSRQEEARQEENVTAPND